ncbi:MAG: hypothetical protein ABI955_08425 [Nitrospirota bacterium]
MQKACTGLLKQVKPCFRPHAVSDLCNNQFQRLWVPKQRIDSMPLGMSEKVSGVWQFVASDGDDVRI